MLRDKNLIALSHQHQHALALCVRLDRSIQSGEVDTDAWQAEIQQIFEREIGVHFQAEERALFPAAVSFPELRALVEELLTEHKRLRELFASARKRQLAPSDFRNFADTLSAHIRKEERQLFETMQQKLSADELASLGKALAPALAASSQPCLIPSGATRLRPKISG